LGPLIIFVTVEAGIFKFGTQFSVKLLLTGYYVG